MAHMIPATVSQETLSEAEKKFFAHLSEHLDDTFTIFHSYDILSRNHEGKLVDGEIDFLIFCPQKGILVIEVKGGVITYDGTSNTWYQNNKQLKKSPFRQAEQYKYKIVEYLTDCLKCKYLPIQYGHSVCFPDIYEQISKLPAEADRSIMITGKELNYLDKVIPAIIEEFQNEKRPLNAHDLFKIKMALAPVFEYGASVCSQINKAEEKIFSLTEQQCRYLNFLGDRKRVLIEGCAGSGKTVMAIKKARQFAEEGKKVLFLAYNRLITAQIHLALCRYEKQIEVATYHGFCVSKLQEAGHPIEFPEYPPPEFYTEDIPQKFSSHIADSPIKYDAIIIDEGQDFLLEYWCTIEELLEKDGYFYIFYDSDQNLYDTNMVFPIDGEPFTLNENCRNSKSIFNSLSQHISDGHIASMPGLPEGKPVIEMTAISEKKQRKNLRRVLNKLIVEDKLSTKDIVILGGHSLRNTSIGDDPVIDNYTISEEQGGKSNNIQYYTYMAYKGCEADVVILLDVDESDDRWNNPHALYTAKSRAKHILYVLRYLDSDEA